MKLRGLIFEPTYTGYVFGTRSLNISFRDDKMRELQIAQFKAIMDEDERITYPPSIVHAFVKYYK